jgi:hypothetical protein
VPTKAIYREFDDDPSLEFDFYLAETLGWRTVEDLRRGMSNMEYQQWYIYQARKAQRIELEAEKAKGGG